MTSWTAILDWKKPMMSQSYILNYKLGAEVISTGKSNQLIVQCQIISPENIYLHNLKHE